MARKFEVTMWVEVSLDVNAETHEDAEARALSKLENSAAHAGIKIRDAGQPTSTELTPEKKR